MNWKVCRDEKPADVDDGAGESVDVLLAWMEGDDSDPFVTETWPVYGVGFYRHDGNDTGWYVFDHEGWTFPVEPVFWAAFSNPFEIVESWEVDYRPKGSMA